MEIIAWRELGRQAGQMGLASAAPWPETLSSGQWLTMTVPPKPVMMRSKATNELVPAPRHLLKSLVSSSVRVRYCQRGLPGATAKDTTVQAL